MANQRHERRLPPFLRGMGRLFDPGDSLNDSKSVHAAPQTTDEVLYESLAQLQRNAEYVVAWATREEFSQRITERLEHPEEVEIPLALQDYLASTSSTSAPAPREVVDLLSTAAFTAMSRAGAVETLRVVLAVAAELGTGRLIAEASPAAAHPAPSPQSAKMTGGAVVTKHAG